MKITTFLAIASICSILFLNVNSLSPNHSLDNPLKVNQDRLENHIMELAKFGKDSLGGTSRVAYSPADIKGREYAIKLMKAAGLEVSIDFGGNIHGKRAGNDPDKKPITFGSHIDTVPNGGNYDGCVGSLSAIEVAQTLADRNIKTDHPLEIILFSNEEGGLLGSRALAGDFNPGALDITSNSGLTIRDGIEAIGGNPDKISETALHKGDLAAYLELHIEQGAILDSKNLDIGVVEGIVGIEEWDVTVEGFANHAGTTPMNIRKDALVAASKLIIAVNEEITSVDGRQVGTVGKIKAFPGAPNVVPGKVIFSLEIRDLSKDKIWQLFEAIQKRGMAIAKSSGTKITFTHLDLTDTPAQADNGIQQAITESVKALGLSYQRMPSGAGHDAQEMARLCPMGMIFVPSVGGISHSPKEFTSAEDMANGANVLLNSILTLDKKLK